MAHPSPVRNHLAPGSSAIPDKLYFRIGEVARLCEVPAYVLRFWETEFPQLRPNKGGTGQRLFRRRDVEIALRIKGLLYEEGYTIPGARQLLRAEGKGREPQLLARSGELTGCPRRAAPVTAAGAPSLAGDRLRLAAGHARNSGAPASPVHPPGPTVRETVRLRPCPRRDGRRRPITPHLTAIEKDQRLPNERISRATGDQGARAQVCHPGLRRRRRRRLRRGSGRCAGSVPVLYRAELSPLSVARGRPQIAFV